MCYGRSVRGVRFLHIHGIRCGRRRGQDVSHSRLHLAGVEWKYIGRRRRTCGSFIRVCRRHVARQGSSHVEMAVGWHDGDFPLTAWRIPEASVYPCAAKMAALHAGGSQFTATADSVATSCVPPTVGRAVLGEPHGRGGVPCLPIFVLARRVRIWHTKLVESFRRARRFLRVPSNLVDWLANGVEVVFANTLF